MSRFRDYINGNNIHIIVQTQVYPPTRVMPEWLVDYFNGDYVRVAMDEYFLDKYGDKILDEVLIHDTRTETIQAIQRRINSYLLINHHIYERLWKNYNSEYEPIDNYDRKEENSTTYAKVTNTETLGAIKNSELLDNVVNITNNEVAPFDRTAYTDTNATTVTTEGHGADGKIVNTSQTNERTNTNTTGGDNEDGSRTDKFTSHIHGNIGVTTSSQLLSEDNTLWRERMDFYDFLFKHCIDECCIGLWG